MTNGREYARAYYHSHKEQMKAAHQKWYERNKEYLKQYRKKWWAKKRGKDNRTHGKSVLYSVWNNYTDEVLIVDGTKEECAKVMGISPCSLPAMITRAKQGKLKKWTFEKTLIREMEE